MDPMEGAMSVLETSTIDSEVDIFEGFERSVRKHERFLMWTGMFARGTRGDDVSVVAKSLPCAALPTDRGVHIQMSDGRWVDVFAQEDTFSIRRSCGFHFARPWYSNENAFSHVRKAIWNFLRN